MVINDGYCLQMTILSAIVIDIVRSRDCKSSDRLQRLSKYGYILFFPFEI